MSCLRERYITSFTKGGKTVYVVRVPKPGGGTYRQCCFSERKYRKAGALEAAKQYRAECIKAGMPPVAERRLQSENHTPEQKKMLAAAKEIYACGHSLQHLITLGMLVDDQLSGIDIGELYSDPADKGRRHIRTLAAAGLAKEIIRNRKKYKGFIRVKIYSATEKGRKLGDAISVLIAGTKRTGTTPHPRSLYANVFKDVKRNNLMLPSFICLQLAAMGIDSPTKIQREVGIGITCVSGCHARLRESGLLTKSFWPTSTWRHSPDKGRYKREAIAAAKAKR